MTSALFEPLALRSLTLRNRILVSPMCQYSAEHGNAVDWHLMHLGAMTQSAAGLVLIEATAVSDAGRITPGCLGLWNDANEAALARVLHGVRAHALAPLGMQLSHAGRKGSCAVPWEGGKALAVRPDSTGQGSDGWRSEAWETLAPSALPHTPGDPPPRAMTAADLATVQAEFVAAALRAERLGVVALELHCAHGYLLHQFLSPDSNRRDDAYGGSLENRMRFPLEVFDAVRAVWPAHKPLGVRVSASDWLEHLAVPSWTLEQTVEFAQQLKARGCDFIDVSSGGISPLQNITLSAGYQVRFAQTVRAATGLPTIAVGLITEPQQAETIVASGQADMVALARALLWNPRWVWHAAAALNALTEAPPQYLRSAPRGQAKLFSAPPFVAG